VRANQETQAHAAAFSVPRFSTPDLSPLSGIFVVSGTKMNDLKIRDGSGTEEKVCSIEETKRTCLASSSLNEESTDFGFSISWYDLSVFVIEVCLSVRP
jgi:hypothetical protein